jgi:lysyl-tRNA synthetase class 2
MTESNWKKLRSGQMDWSVFRMRHDLMRAMRSFFDAREYLETDAPLLTPCPTLDANILPVGAEVRSEKGMPLRLFLHTSPEYAMKKLLAAGAEKIYFLGKVFRDGECTPLHNPEFTMLEWYRANAVYTDIMDETEALIRDAAVQLLKSERILFQDKAIDLSPPWPRVTVKDLFLTKIGLELEPNTDLTGLKNTADRLGIYFHPEDDWETVFLRIFMEKIEPGLGVPQPVFIKDYPLQLGLNAKRKEDTPGWTERLELYIGGLEIANGYTELTDADEQKKRFESDQERKFREMGKRLPIDEELIDALRLGLPPCSGIAFGVDRFLMLLTNQKRIQDVLLFPFHHWEKNP